MANGLSCNTIPYRWLYAYMIIIVLMYAYKHVKTCYGDIIGGIPGYDVLGKYKCIIRTKNCERQVLDGWQLANFAAYIIIGYYNTLGHSRTLAISVISEVYSYYVGKETNPILDVATCMAGYSLGSALCPAACL